MRQDFYKNLFAYFLAAIGGICFLGCVPMQHQIITPTPNFSWSPPAGTKKQINNLKIAIVSSVFKESSKLGSYEGKGYLKTFLDSLSSDLESTFISRGINITGPYENLDVMTFPEKKNVDLILMPEIIINVDEKYTINTDRPSLGGKAIEKKGTILVTGSAYFVLFEPLSLQKLWNKTVKFPQCNEQVLVDLLMDSTGRLNQFYACNVSGHIKPAS